MLTSNRIFESISGIVSVLFLLLFDWKSIFNDVLWKAIFATVSLVLMSIAIFFMVDLLLTLIFTSLVAYKNPKHYKYKVNEVILGDGSTKYSAVVYKEFGGYPHYIIKGRILSGYYKLYDEEYTEDNLDNRKAIYYDTEAEAHYAVVEYKKQEEREYRDNKHRKQRKKAEKNNMREKSSKTINVNFEQK